MTDSSLAAILNENGLRNTAERRRILSLFMTDRTWTVAQVHRNLKDTDLSTVYRNVNALAENGILAQTAVRGKEAHYELADRDHHAHRVCRRCGSAFCIPCPMGGVTDDHDLEIYSVCTECSGDVL